MELFFRSFVLVVLLTLSGAACAVGMGGINVSSALGEPLNAEIELAGIGYKANMGGSLTARIASPEVFKGAGLDYPYALPGLKFIIESRADGKPYLRITSLAPVNDPFVTLLVELNWPSGRLLREYTFLLDPPGFKPEQPTEARVKPLAPIAVSSSQYPSVESVNIGTAPASTGAPVVTTSAIVDMPEADGRTSSGKIVVKRGDTLRKIAQYAGSADISLERMLVALYRANANEFDGHNMNRIRVGKILRMPSKDIIEKVTQTNALEEIHVQAADWDAYRQKLAAASITAKEPPSSQEITGKISAKVADSAPAAKESAKEVVRLSKGEAPGDKAVTGGKSKAVNDKVAGLQEELIAKDIRLKDTNKRIELLENNIREMQHLMELKSQTMAAAKLAETKPVPPPASAESKPVATAVVPSDKAAASVGGSKDAQQAKPAAPHPPATASEAPPSSSIMDELFGGNLIYLAGFAAVLLALGGGVIFVRRRKRRNQGWGNLEKSILEPAVPAAVPGDFAQATTVISAVVPEEEIDPVKEAELFLNFGRDTQAEEILKDALEKDPNNRNILLKLLSIYLERKDAKSFDAIALQVRDLGDVSTWAQVAAMGRQLESDNPAYGIEGESERAVETIIPEPVKKEQTSHGLDFDLDFGGEKFGTSASAVIDLEKPSESSALDFDLGDVMAGIDGVVKAEARDDKTAQFSLDGNQPVQSNTQHDSIGLSSSSMSLPVGGMEFVKPIVDEVIDLPSKSLSFPVGGMELVMNDADSAAAPAVDEVIDITSKSMSLSLPVWGVEVGKVDTEEEISPAEDEVIDITSMSMSLPPGRAEIAAHVTVGKETPDNDEVIDITSKSMSLPVEKGEIGMVSPMQNDSSIFQGIDLNLGEPIAVDAVPEVKDEHWAEIATKIDLAKAYQEMGDSTGAHEILKEVMDEGNAQQRATAKSMLGILAS